MTGLNFIAIVYNNVSTYRSIVSLLLSFSDNTDTGDFLLIAVFDNYHFAVTGLVVHYFAESNAFYEVFKFDSSGNIRKNQSVPWVNRTKCFATFYFLFVFHSENRTVR